MCGYTVDSMDPLIARKTWRTAEPIHAMIYFVPEATEQYRSVGVEHERAGYFASRAASLGEASAELVIATFYNFSPDAVRSAIPMTWLTAPPQELVNARLTAAGLALHRMLGTAADSDDVAEAAELARRAALVASERIEGRPLFAGHANLSWPSEPILVLWHAQTLLREFRGDGHIAALIADGVSGLEALVMHGATGEVPPSVLKSTRQWSDKAWAAAADGLIEAGWLTDDHELTDLGRTHRLWVEDRTDELSLAPYRSLGEAGCTRLQELTRPLSKAIVESGALTPVRR